VLALAEVIVRTEVVKRLLNINRRFYQSFAEPFRASRGRLQSGVVRTLELVDISANVLDLGCAHGLLAEALMQRGFTGRYMGLDSSPLLLEAVPTHLKPPHYNFALADLAEKDWHQTAQALLRGDENGAEDDAGGYDWIVAFAVLHHLPSEAVRSSIVKAARSLLNVDSRLAVSVWDFLESPRLRERIVGWSQVDLSEQDVDEGDYLVDWREGGRGVRYIHHFTEPELAALGQKAGFRVIDQYRSDGENGRLGLYQVWEVSGPDPRNGVR
jgi:SAM-dependent methyltransferase